MHILLTTYGLILVMALFAMAQWRSAENLAYFDIAAKDVFTNARETALKTINKTSNKAYLKLRPKPDGKKEKDKEEIEDEEEVIETPDKLNDKEEKKPSGKRTSLLHIGDLFNDENASITEGKTKACYIILKNLVTELYSGQEFFEEAKEVSPDLEERFILNLLEKAKEKVEKGAHFRAAKQLACLNLNDELHSYIRFKILTGNKYRSRNDKNEDTGYFPLLEFVSMKNHNSIMSIWLAPKPLLNALFQNEDVVEELIKTRREIYNDLKKDKNKSAVDAKANELKLRYSSYLQGIDPKFIDFQVSRTEPKD